MTDYKANPELALEVLQKITDEIPSGISANDIKKAMPMVLDPSEFVAFNCKQITAYLKEDLNNFWDDMQVNQKLRQLKDLENISTPKPLWFPLSSHSDINRIKQSSLLLMKKKILKEIQKVKKESSEICQYLNEKSKLFNDQIEEIYNIDPEEVLDRLKR